jgi:hypothetical protein
MYNRIRGFAYAALFAAAIAVLSFTVAAQQVPQLPQPPADEQLLLQVHAKGDQVYICKSDAAQFTWTLKAPDAQLFDKDGKSFGKHFAGPSWEANDGSRVTGKTVISSPSPDANSIPWLLVTILSHDGSGVLSRATSIQRVNTQDGKAPSSGCDPSHIGQEVRVPYSADYRFYSPQQPSPTVASVVDREISAIEKQVVDAAEAMPEDKFNFSPESLNIPGDDYKGVRTFAVQVKHIAASNYFIWSPLTGDKVPENIKDGNGPADLKSKADVIKFLKDSFALGHKAAATLTAENMLQIPERSKSTRLHLATFGVAHAYDHYGQMVEYLRMNGIVPPASRAKSD